MNKKDLLIALTIASVESGEAGIIWDSIPNSIKQRSVLNQPQLHKVLHMTVG